MGETDVTFRHLLRGLPRPILRLAFPRRKLEPLGPLDQWEDKGRAKGLAKGRAAEARLLLHKVLAVRSFPVTPDLRARIDRERDVARLESWLEAAVTAGAIGDVFRDARWLTSPGAR